MNGSPRVLSPSGTFTRRDSQRGRRHRLSGEALTAAAHFARCEPCVISLNVSARCATTLSRHALQSAFELRHDHMNAGFTDGCSIASSRTVMKRSNDWEHLLRMAAVFVAGIVIFLVFRAWSVPKSFGEYGHYRGDFITEEAARPMRYAGHEACEACHPEVLEVKSAGKHAGIACEACHGPLEQHAEDPSSNKPALPDATALCARCHEANLARPQWFPQVATAEHSQGLVCKTCHRPHNPGPRDATHADQTKDESR